jgi:hypothetical protein
VDLNRLCGRGDWSARRWRVFLVTRAGVLRRRRGAFEVDDTLVGTHDLVAPGGVRALATVSAAGGLTLNVVTRWARLETLNDGDGEVEIGVGIYARAGSKPALKLVRRSDGLELAYPLQAPARDAEARHVGRVPVRDLLGAPPSLELSARGAGDELWDVWVDCAGAALPLALRNEQAGGHWHTGRESLTLIRTSRGDAALNTHHAGSPKASAEPTTRELAGLERTTSPASLRRPAAA